MNIYKDAISASLGIRPITDYFPDYQHPEIPEDATLDVSGPMNPFWGRKHSPETKARLRKAWDNPQRKHELSQRSRDPEICKKRSKSVKAWYDNASTEEINAKTKSGLKSMNAHVECPHCGIKTNKGNIGRYHGDKCKKRIS